MLISVPCSPFSDQLKVAFAHPHFNLSFAFVELVPPGVETIPGTFSKRKMAGWFDFRLATIPAMISATFSTRSFFKNTTAPKIIRKPNRCRAPHKRTSPPHPGIRQRLGARETAERNTASPTISHENPKRGFHNRIRYIYGHEL